MNDVWQNAGKHKGALDPLLFWGKYITIPERSGMRIACFNIRMKVVLDIKVSRTVGMSADQNPAERKNKNSDNVVRW